MKIGFCFLIYDKIYNLNLWRPFFDNILNDAYAIYIHSKAIIISLLLKTVWCLIIFLKPKGRL